MLNTLLIEFFFGITIRTGWKDPKPTPLTIIVREETNTTLSNKVFFCTQNNLIYKTLLKLNKKKKTLLTKSRIKEREIGFFSFSLADSAKHLCLTFPSFFSLLTPSHSSYNFLFNFIFF